MGGFAVRRRFALAAAIVVGGVALTAASAAAMDCVVVHRSAVGAVHASSKNWTVVTTADVVNFCWPGSSQPQIDAATAAVEAAGYPTVFTTRINKVLPDNGHGIVHIDNEYGGVIATVLGPPTSC